MMNSRKFVMGIIIKSCIYAIITIIVLNLSYNPIITNELAMTQMENSNELYLLMEAVNKTKHYISIIYGCVTMFFGATIIYDIYKLTKTKEKM